MAKGRLDERIPQLMAQYDVPGVSMAHIRNGKLVWSNAYGYADIQTGQQLYTPQVDIPGLSGAVADSYGLGHFIEKLPNGRQAVWHGGQGHGWMTHFHLIPASGDGIVILTNSQRSWPLIAQVLRDWSTWSGIGPVKFSRITYAVTGLQIVVGLIMLASLWQFYRLAAGLLSGSRRFAPLSIAHRRARLILAVLGVGIMAALTWRVRQPYLMVSSLFPTIASRAGLSLLGLAIVLLLLALFPVYKESKIRTPLHSSP